MNKRNCLLAIFWGVLLTAMLGGCSTQTVQPTAEVNVAAAVSLKDALTEIQASYQQKNPGVKLVYNLGASGALQKQIEQGAATDLFISAAPKQMDELEQKGLISKESRKNLVENKLVLVVPRGSAKEVRGVADLGTEKIRQFSMGEPLTVPAGQYAQEVIAFLGIGTALSGKAVFAKDVRTVLTYVETGNVDAGIVYMTDAVGSQKVEIVAHAPAGSHTAILYPAAVLAGAKQARAAEAFLQYLFSAESAAVFEKYGFGMAK